MSTTKVEFITLPGVPLIWPGDDLAKIIIEGLTHENLKFEDGDVLALAQKIVSKSEGQLVNLAEVQPSARALELAPLVGKDPRHVEVILRESKEVIWASPGIFVVETHHGFVCANAGVDRSNIEQNRNKGQEKENQASLTTSNEWLCLLPRDPNRSAALLRAQIKALTGAEIAVLINDTHGRPFRMGGVGVAVGSAGLTALVDQRGEPDMFGYTLQATLVGLGDELASAASLMMGQAAEATPAVLIRGLSYRRPDSARPDPGASELVRPKDKDVFRYPAHRD